MSVLVKTPIDAWVDQSSASVTHSDSARLRLNGGAGSDNCRAFIFFARPFPLGAVILDATLKVYLANTWASSQVITAKRVTDSWKEGTVNWTNQPSVSGTNSADATVSSGVAGQEVTFDVTEMLGDVSSGSAWYGVRLELDTDVDRVIWSSENPTAAYRPVLEIEYGVEPKPPANLAPSGERAISLEFPTLTWEFKDNRGDSSQTSSQVQISTSTSFASPEYDSGKESNTESQWDLSATAYAGLDNDDVRYWRVKVWGDSDLESDWSDVEQFERKTKGTLEIVNPPDTPDNFVEETTPPLDWTFTGRTQERAAVNLYETNEKGLESLVYRWPDETDTSVTVPKGILKSTRTYRVRIRVWDDLDRQSMAGDTDYVEAERGFTYEREGTPTAPSTLTAVPDGPKVVLTWTRATEPDWFSLRVDGREEEDRIDPEDVFVSGTTYEMDWWGAIPNQESTYEIEAVVNDAGKLKHSDGNPTADATTTPYGITLVDPEDSTFVFIAGKEDADLSIGETATTFDVLGQRKPIRVTEGVGGYEGTLSGIILDPDHRDNFLDLKGRLNRLRVIFGDQNLIIRLEDTSVAPSPDSQMTYPVSFSFFQDGGFTFSIEGD